MAHYYLNPSYEYFNVTHGIAVNAADYFVPSTFIGTLICVVMHITSNHCIHTKGSYYELIGIQFLAMGSLIVLTVEFCLFALTLVSGYYNIFNVYYFTSGCCISISMLMNGWLHCCLSRNKSTTHKRTVCVSHTMITVLCFVLVIILLTISIATPHNTEPRFYNPNQNSWENVTHFSFISVGNYIFSASQLPLVLLFLTINSYKIYVTVINKQHHMYKVDKLEHSENLLPIRRSTGSDYGTTSNNMVIINIMS